MNFSYIARTKNGEIQTGIVRASTKETAVEMLQASNLIVLSCESSSNLPLWLKDIKILQRVKYKEIVNFFSKKYDRDVKIVKGLRSSVKVLEIE